MTTHKAELLKIADEMAATNPDDSSTVGNRLDGWEREIRALAALPESAKGEPCAWQFRHRNGTDSPWSAWQDCDHERHVTIQAKHAEGKSMCSDSRALCSTYQIPAAVSADDLLEAYRKWIKRILVGEEHSGRGASSYNWHTEALRQLLALESALRGEGK